jgi:hypothetical protein
LTWSVLAAGLCSATSARSQDKQRIPDFWELTRTSSVVVVGTVTRVEARVGIAVAKVLKGPVAAGQALEFEFTPPVPSKVQGEPPWYLHAPRPERFVVGDTSLVFLRGDGPTYELAGGATGEFLRTAEQAVRDVLRLDALPDARARCTLLVQLVSTPLSSSAPAAWKELEQHYNKPEHFELLAPLATVPHLRSFYVDLLRRNASPRASTVLRGYLATEKGRLLEETILALCSKETENDSLSRDLVPFLRHEEAGVRKLALFVLCCREYSEATPEVVQRLDDADPGVRSQALCWPWSQQRDPNAVCRIRQLLGDSSDEVRASACRSLISIRDMRSFYRLLAATLLDRSRAVRSSAVPLDLLWEGRPAAVAALLLWPSAVAVLVFFRLARGLGTPRRVQSAALGLVLGYVAGVASGFVVGALDGGGYVFRATILYPPLFMPLGVLVRGLVHRRGRKRTAVMFVAAALLLCAAVGLATWSFNVWPGIFLGFLILALATLWAPAHGRIAPASATCG